MTGANEEMSWRPWLTAPRDGTWIIGMSLHEDASVYLDVMAFDPADNTWMAPDDCSVYDGVGDGDTRYTAYRVGWIPCPNADKVVELVRETSKRREITLANKEKEREE